MQKLITEKKWIEKTNANMEELARRSLMDLVFSWSLEDVLNKYLYKNQVRVFFFLSKYINY